MGHPRKAGSGVAAQAELVASFTPHVMSGAEAGWGKTVRRRECPLLTETRAW